MDEYLHDLLTKEAVFDIQLPFLQGRWKLEDEGKLEKRRSELDEEFQKELAKAREEARDTSATPMVQNTVKPLEPSKKDIEIPERQKKRDEKSDRKSKKKQDLSDADYVNDL